MLHTKFRENRPASSGGEHFYWFLPPWSCDLDFAINFRSFYPWLLHIKFHFDWPSGFKEEEDL